MQKISNASELKAYIRDLEIKTQRQEQALKDNAKSTIKGIKPLNLLRIGISKASTTPDIKSSAISTFIGLAAGFISRKFVVGKSKNIFKRTLGAAIQAGITRYLFKRLPVMQKKSAFFLSKNALKQRKSIEPLLFDRTNKR